LLPIKKKRIQKFGGHSKAQVIDAIIKCNGFVSSVAKTLGVDIHAVSPVLRFLKYHNI